MPDSSREASHAAIARLSSANDDAVLQSFIKEDAALRAQQDADDRESALRGHNRLYKYELARHRALASAQRKGVPLPPVPIYRSQREWSLEVSSRQEQLERQESTIRELHEVIRDQAVSLDERREEADWIHVADHQVEKLERTERELHHVRTEALAIKKKYDQLKQDVRQLCCDKCYDVIKARHRRSYLDHTDTATTRIM